MDIKFSCIFMVYTVCALYLLAIFYAIYTQMKLESDNFYFFFLPISLNVLFANVVTEYETHRVNLSRSHYVCVFYFFFFQRREWQSEENERREHPQLRSVHHRRHVIFASVTSALAGKLNRFHGTCICLQMQGKWWNEMDHNFIYLFFFFYVLYFHEFLMHALSPLPELKCHF